MEGGSSWFEYKTEEGRSYYHNASSGVTQWERPTEFDKENSHVGVVSLEDEKNEGGDIAFASIKGTAGLDGRMSGSNSRHSKSADADRGAGGGMSGGKFLCFDLGFLRSFFDISSVEVMHRVVFSLFPFFPLSRPADPAVLDFRGKPDWYGPTWISTTLILSIFATSNYGHWFQNHGYGTDFTFVSMIAALIWGTLGILPLTVMLVLRLTTTTEAVTSEGTSAGASAWGLRSLVCVFGYSMTPYIIASLLCMTPNTAVKWLSSVVGCVFALSFATACLVRDVGSRSALTEGHVLLRYIIFGYTLISQVTLFVLFRLVFFGF